MPASSAAWASDNEAGGTPNQCHAAASAPTTLPPNEALPQCRGGRPPAHSTMGTETGILDRHHRCRQPPTIALVRPWRAPATFSISECRERMTLGIEDQGRQLRAMRGKSRVGQHARGGFKGDGWQQCCHHQAQQNPGEQNRPSPPPKGADGFAIRSMKGRGNAIHEWSHQKVDDPNKWEPERQANL
jgi:hypothetical protein